MRLADVVNACGCQQTLGAGKQPGEHASRLHDVCSTCIEAFRLLTHLKPVLPRWRLGGSVLAHRTAAMGAYRPARVASGHRIGSTNTSCSACSLSNWTRCLLPRGACGQAVPAAPAPGRSPGRGHRGQHWHRRLRQSGPAHRPNRRLRARGGLRKLLRLTLDVGGASTHRSAHLAQRVQRHCQRLPARAVGRQYTVMVANLAPRKDEVRRV